MDCECNSCGLIYEYCQCGQDDLTKQQSNASQGNYDYCSSCNNTSYYCSCNDLEKKVSEDLSQPVTGQNFRVFDTSGVLKQRNYLINSIANDSYGLSQEEATLILIYFQWSKDSFDLNWWDKQDEIKNKSGITISKKSEELLKKQKIPDSTKMCLVCYCDGELESLACKHNFCSFCWRDYLKVKTEDFLVSLSSTCLQKDCPLIIPEKFFYKYLSNDKSEISNFQKSVTRNFINTNKNLKLCTNPSCSYIIECFSGRAQEVRCLCGTFFCFGCERETHRPITCSLVNKWDQAHAKESADELWVKANTKTCPHCKQSIERSTGCLYMLCDKRAGGCGKAFCYVCETDWSKHTQDHFTCNKYTPGVQKKEDEAAMIKEELKRMEHYYNRFTNFKVSQKMSLDLKPKIEKMQVKFIELSIPYSELKFLNESVECIINTNNTIKNTYIFGYYLTDGKEKNLFEHNQGMLEKNSDNLYKLIDIDMEQLFEINETKGYTEFKKKFDETKSRAVNYTSASNRFQNGVNEYVETEEMQSLLDLEGKTRKYQPPEKKKDHFKYVNEA